MKIIKKIKSAIKPIYLRAFSRVQCNLCGWRDIHFKSDSWHRYSICPNCNSYVRQRLLFGIMNNSQDVSLDLIIKNKSILHFAPDKCLETFLKSIAKLYKTADLLTEGYNYHNIDYNLDMSKMSKIKDSEFDCVIAIDVLEHVPNDVLAVRETYRILKNGGYCIFMIPQKDGLETTFEDSSITDPDKRKEIFGQWDHLRIYGSDFEKTLKNAGFDVVVKDAKDLNSKIVKKFVLHPPIESEHPLATNHRKVYFGRKD